MTDTMSFPQTIEEFMDQYKIVDTEQVYSNGVEFVPIFRVKQWFEHLPNPKDIFYDGYAYCLVDFGWDTVLCKDCKWYTQFTSMTGKLLSEGRCEYHSNYFAEDDFCSRGERKESK